MTSEVAMAEIFELLHQAHGAQHWWPGDSVFEIMAGAILTQNTNWKNVEKSLFNLQQQALLDPQSIVEIPDQKLANWLIPSGYFNLKTKRLKTYCTWYLEQGGFEALQRQETETLRTALLGINGIGPETADSILLYAFERPVFVIDAYTRRLLRRLGHIGGNENYEELRARMEEELPPDVTLFNEFHALIVNHAKIFCRKKPLCEGCPLEPLCAQSSSST